MGMKTKVLIGFVALVVLGGVAFSTLGGMSWLDSKGLRGQERLVRSRMESYWKARVEGDMEGMAAYTHPLQSEIVEPGLLQTERFEIHDVKVDGDTATAKITVQSRLKHPLLSAKAREITMEGRWVKYDGTWYREPKPVGLHEVIQRYQGTWTPPGEQQQDQSQQEVEPAKE